jgi:hypothetical protein
MTREEIRSELAPVIAGALAVLKEKRFFEVSFAVGDGLERRRFTNTEDAFEEYRLQVENGNRDVAVNAKTDRIEFRGLSYYPFLLSLFNTFQGGNVCPTANWPYKKVQDFNERVLIALTKGFVQSLDSDDGEIACEIRAEMIAKIVV